MCAILSDALTRPSCVTFRFSVPKSADGGSAVGLKDVKHSDITADTITS